MLLGKGDVTFTRGVSATLGSYADALRSPNASALGDFNGDSRPDLVATDPRTGTIYIQLNEVGWIVPGALWISDAPAVTEGNTGTVNAIFTVTLAEALVADPPPPGAPIVLVAFGPGLGIEAALLRA